MRNREREAAICYSRTDAATALGYYMADVPDDLKVGQTSGRIRLNCYAMCRVGKWLY